MFAVCCFQLQSDYASIADACEVWAGLLRNPVLQAHQKTVEDRFSQAVDDIHVMAHMLHTKYRGEGLSEELKEHARQWLEEEHPDFLPYVIAFAAGDDPFPQSLCREQVLKNTRSVTWWKSIRNSASIKIPPEFSSFVIQLMKLPASSASIERVFSNFGHIWSKLRNRLGLEKAAKLVFCFRILNLKEGFKPDW
jgi:hypothetical protein